MSTSPKSWSDKVLTSIYEAGTKAPPPKNPTGHVRRTGGPQGEELIALMQFDFVSAEDLLNAITNIYLAEDLGV